MPLFEVIMKDFKIQVTIDGEGVVVDRKGFLELLEEPKEVTSKETKPKKTTKKKEEAK